jgi:hypothetical protein
MNPAIVLQILAGIQVILNAAPQVESLVKSVKDMVTNMFTSGEITKEVQDALHDEIDVIVARAQANEWPAHWQVEPDPTDDPKP